MLDKIYITQHCASLKLKSAQKYNIAPEKCHIGHLLLQGMLEAPNTECQIDAATDESETNLSVATRCMRLASGMSKFGLLPGDVVIIMGYSHIDLCIPFYACHFNGYSVCAFDPSTIASDVQALFPYIQPKMVFCQEACVEKVKNAFTANKLKGKIVIFDDKQNNLATFIEEYKGTEINYRPAEFDHAKINAWLMLTSGTTGLPKVAMIPFETLLNGICCWWQPYTKRYKRALIMANLQWISSYIFYVSSPLRCFTRVQSSTPLTPPALIGIINKYRPNVTAWTPFFINQFIIAAEKGICDLSCFDAIAIGGAKMELPLLNRFKKICPAWLNLAYGMTELLVPIFHFDDSVPDNSVGYPKEQYQYKLIDEDGNVVEKPFKSGELWVKGDDFFKGYLNNPEETEKMLTSDGWFKTGDIFYRDDEDFYFFVERKRLLIRHFGHFISPLQLEELIKEHPGVLDAAVVGIPDPDQLERATAAIQTRNGGKVDPEDIFSKIRESLPEYKQLSGGIFFVDSLPATASGKVNRSLLRQISIDAEKIMPKKKHELN